MAYRVLISLLATTTTVAAVFCLGTVGLLAWRVLDEIDAAGGVSFLAEPTADLVLDRLNESGLGDTTLDEDDPLLKSRTLVVTEGMNERVARRVVRELRYLAMTNDSAPITMHLSTPGGWLDAAFMIVDAMRTIKPKVDVIATGGCYSAGTVILAGATGKRAATPDALLSIHVNDYLDDGPYGPDTQELARFRRIYEERTEVPAEWFDEPGDNQFYFDAQEALDMRLIDEIVPSEHLAPPARELERRPAA